MITVSPPFIVYKAYQKAKEHDILNKILFEVTVGFGAQTVINNTLFTAVYNLQGWDNPAEDYWHCWCVIGYMVISQIQKHMTWQKGTLIAQAVWSLNHSYRGCGLLLNGSWILDLLG